MFGISFNELLVVLIIALLFIRPTDIPSIAKGYKSFIKTITKFKREFKNHFVEIHNQTIDINQKINAGELEVSEDELKIASIDKSSYVMDDEGKFHKCYDISEYKKKSH